MGKFPKAMFGAFRGRVGAIVGGKWKDVETLRTRSEGGTSNPSDLQLQQRAKFGMRMRFMSAIKIVLDTVNYLTGSMVKRGLLYRAGRSDLALLFEEKEHNEQQNR